ncbi:DUF2306 domain-containing protein [Luteibacter aegosomaticola]|uniref:DUF2306 domain-containing protein n=1 Tax=Luteibacter aegosomaticola TaxID=2911538 RepID=UPI001FF8AB41|nr:DUF2306 domain-containing protein [Luteibacter aegosomaticola]UPG92174.1 DUF2306 domain-containing protein [Luteibacter aegosomaticola]
MDTRAQNPEIRRYIRRVDTLRIAATLWCLIAVLGQFVFAAYIVATYGAASIHGDPTAWNRVWPSGYVQGERLGNLAVAVHVLLAAFVIASGSLQILPSLRRNYPRFHRWNGRAYLASLLTVSIAGLWMLAFDRGFVGASQNGNVAINGVLLILCCAFAWAAARRRDLSAHRRWALRVFALAAGVWVFRIGLAGWIAIRGGLVGFDPATMQGPALAALSICEWVAPLLLLELYLRAEQSRRPFVRLTVAVTLVITAAATGYGAYCASVGMWIPAMIRH